MRIFVPLVFASMLLAQKKATPVDPREIGNRALPFENLQNDLGSAVAHVPRLSGEQRAKIDKANLVLGQAAADRREQHKVDKKKILAALKDLAALEKLFPVEDQKHLAEDRKKAEAAAKEPTEVRYVYVGKAGQPI